MFRHYDPSIFSSRPSLFCSADDVGADGAAGGTGGAAGSGSGGAAAGAGKEGAAAGDGKAADGKDAGKDGAAAGDDDKPVTMGQLKALLADALKGKPADAGKEADKGAAAAKGKDAGNKGAESPDFVPRADFEALQERLNRLEKHDEKSVREARVTILRDAGIKPAYEKFIPDNWDPTTDAGRAVAETFRKDHADMFEDRKATPAGGGTGTGTGGGEPAQTKGRSFAAKVAGSLARR